MGNTASLPSNQEGFDELYKQYKQEKTNIIQKLNNIDDRVTKQNEQNIKRNEKIQALEDFRRDMDEMVKKNNSDDNDYADKVDKLINVVNQLTKQLADVKETLEEYKTKDNQIDSITQYTTMMKNEMEEYINANDNRLEQIQQKFDSLKNTLNKPKPDIISTQNSTGKIFNIKTNTNKGRNTTTYNKSDMLNNPIIDKLIDSDNFKEKTKKEVQDAKRALGIK